MMLFNRTPFRCRACNNRFYSGEARAEAIATQRDQHARTASAN
jgi:hypothetical protein